MIVPDRVFEIASNMWEPPDEFEQSEMVVECVSAEHG